MTHESDSSPSIEQVQMIKEKFGDELSKTPNFSGLGVGFLETETGQKKLVIVVNTRDALADDQREILPREIEGIGIDYRVTGSITPLT